MCTYDNLIVAITGNRAELVAEFLSQAPELLLEQDKAGNFLTHYVARDGDYKTISALLVALNECERTDLFFFPNDEGLSALHVAARHNSLDCIEFILRSVPQENLADAVTKLTNDGRFIMNFVQQNPNVHHISLIEALFLPWLFKNDLQPITQKIQTSVILGRYRAVDEGKNAFLTDLLTVSCEAVNRTRSTLQGSESHPESNFYEAKKVKEMRETILNAKNKTAHASSQLMKANLPPLMLKRLLLQNEIKLASENKLGNCREYAFLTLWYFLKLNPRVSVEVGVLDRGDHAFLIINRSQKTSIKDYRTWNFDTVICDAWGGDVFLVSELEKRLKDFYRYNLKSVVAPFNPSAYDINSIFFIEKGEFELKPESQRIFSPVAKAMQVPKPAMSHSLQA